MRNFFLLVVLALFFAGCNASDKNEANTKLVVNDIIKPIITLLGSSSITLKQGVVYRDTGATASDNIDGNITSKIQTNNPLDINRIGTYLITYNVKDSDNNSAIQVTRIIHIVKVADTTKPIITLLGNTTVTVEKGANYSDAGATASDNIDGNITSKIQTSNPVDINRIGTYLITYNVKDSANNSAIQVTRTIHIIKIADTTKPIITLLGNATVTVEKSTNYSDAGATASDNIDGNITSKVQVDNPVDVNLLDTYLITYNVKDAANNQANQVSRTVIVSDRTSPSKPSLTTAPTETDKNTQEIELNGEIGATVWVNGIQRGVIASNSKLTINLDTSGADGTKHFSIILKDSSENSSETLVFSILKSSTDPIFNEFNVGFGGSSSFPFTSVTAGEKIYVSARSFVLDEDIENNASYANIKDFDGAAFSTLQGYLKKSKFLVFWFVDGWEESWYNIPSIQALMDAGYIPIFNYWYFGDKLIEGMPNNVKQDAYALDNIKVANFLAKLDGKKMLIMEPEFNKQPVLASTDSQHKFASIISNAIDTIKIHYPNLLVSLSMMDTGSRGVSNTNSKCGYTNCSLGDAYAWKQPEIVFNDLSNKLDFISFHQMIGQFSRDFENPGDWNNPNPRTFTDEELGIDFFAERIVNFSKFLHNKYNKPVFLPYIAIMTATWDEDSNSNQKIEDNEINYNGWQDKADDTYKRLAESKASLKENGLFGFAPMALFDNPRQDYGGYQYFINNEYHLGIVGSSAIDEDDIAPYGDLQFKGNVLESIFNFGG